MSDKPRWPHADGLTIAGEIYAALEPVCERIIVAGSLRRRKPTVGDVEILYIGRTETRPDPDDMFATITVNLADEVIAELERTGRLERRRNVNGSEMFGPKNKLMRYRASGMPVDLFAATRENWWNYLVCRTGPADSNTRIASAAQYRGWKWHPYGSGFSRENEEGEREEFTVTCEEDVFRFVGLPFAEPSNRR
jgi:DNA polymerase/3'-5' exonuclease PolX